MDDEHILSGLASLHQAMLMGFDRMERRSEIRFAQIENRLAGVEAQVSHLDNKVARLEHKMLQRVEAVEAVEAVDAVDAVDARIDRHEVRLIALETQRASG